MTDRLVQTLFGLACSLCSPGLPVLLQRKGVAVGMEESLAIMLPALLLAPRVSKRYLPLCRIAPLRRFGSDGQQ